MDEKILLYKYKKTTEVPSAETDRYHRDDDDNQLDSLYGKFSGDYVHI